MGQNEKGGQIRKLGRYGGYQLGNLGQEMIGGHDKFATNYELSPSPTTNEDMEGAEGSSSHEDQVAATGSLTADGSDASSFPGRLLDRERSRR
ncbi:hypothetical protein L914_09339 [Phytophthora nicotianae]|uniref:Uncharacterized protein n=1 Tax=Phytophthora nicotianae TaxID=4792 RepID=W2NAT5_PHYNI|nr:hypothetical protein L914_09339 [Phytophthora nicotianae]